MPGQGKVAGGEAGEKALHAFQAFAFGKPMDTEGRLLLRAKYLEVYAAEGDFFLLALLI